MQQLCDVSSRKTTTEDDGPGPPRSACGGWRCVRERGQATYLFFDIFKGRVLLKAATCANVRLPDIILQSPTHTALLSGGDETTGFYLKIQIGYGFIPKHCEYLGFLQPVARITMLGG